MTTPKPAVSATCARHHDRFPIADAWLEWVDSKGLAWKFQVLDVSRGGLCLGLAADGAALPDPGELDCAVICVGGMRIHGCVIVTQATESLSRGCSYGGEFHPGSPDDKRKFVGLITELQRRARSATTS